MVLERLLYLMLWLRYRGFPRHNKRSNGLKNSGAARGGPEPRDNAPSPAGGGAEGDRAIRLIQQITHGEGTSEETAQAHGFSSGYDVPFGFGKYIAPSRPLTEMTLAEVKRYQAEQIKATKGKIPGTSGGTSAVGKYQVLKSTLEEAQKELGLSDYDVFDADVQDQIGAYLLNKRGFQEYLSGKMSKVDFQRNLSREWASIADPDTGRSYYGQSTGTTLDELEAALRES